MKKSTDKRIFNGVIDITRNGTGFVAHEDFNEDILIERNLLGVALHGDEVNVLMLPSARKGRANGKVLKVIKRARERFVGTIEKGGGKYFLVPDNNRVHVDIEIPMQTAKVQESYKAIAEMHEWTNQDINPTGEIVQILGKAGQHETEMQAILLERNFTDTFPPAVQQEAHQIQSKFSVTRETPFPVASSSSRSPLAQQNSEREDFRDVTTFTIDPADAKDFDDALSVEILENETCRIGIHIADVTHFVRPNTKLDEEARKRATSVYLVDRTVPMLPEELSNDICSLKEGIERFAFSAIFILNKNAEVQKVHFAKTIIKSNKRFTYQEAQDILNSPANVRGDASDIRWALASLRDLARKLREQRVKKGAIEFETDEIGFELDENKKPVRVFVKEKLETMKIVEEFMLLANKHVAEHLALHCKNKKPAQNAFIYRIHGDPDAAKIEELRIFLRALGHDVSTSLDTSQIASKDIAEILHMVKGKPEAELIQTATLRSMAKAIYTHKNIGHFSLGFKHYTHFTSPIRRYPDMMVHRILKAHLDGTLIPKSEMDGYKKAAILSSRREVEAVAAERESVKYKQVEYMNVHIGKVFNGAITGVSKSGFFVAENNTKAEGFISVSSLKDDWYELDEKSYALVGKQKGRTFRIGDKIKIKLKRVSLEEKQIDGEIV